MDGVKGLPSLCGRELNGLEKQGMIKKLLAMALQPSTGVPLPSYMPGVEEKSFGRQQLATFPVDFLGKLEEKIANGNHTITRHLATICNCEQIAKHSDLEHKTWRNDLWQLEVLYRLQSILFERS